MYGCISRLETQPDQGKGTMAEDRLLTYKEAADYLAIHTNTLRALVREKKIVCRRIGPRVVRFAKRDLDAFTERCKVPSH